MLSPFGPSPIISRKQDDDKARARHGYGKQRVDDETNYRTNEMTLQEAGDARSQVNDSVLITT